MLPLLIDIVFSRLRTIPETYLDDADDLALRYESPVATVVRDAAVITQDKVLAFWHLIGPIMQHPAVLLGNTVQSPGSGTAGTLALADVALINLFAVNVKIAVFGLNRIAWQANNPLYVLSLY